MNWLLIVALFVAVIAANVTTTLIAVWHIKDRERSKKFWKRVWKHHFKGLRSAKIYLIKMSRQWRKRKSVPPSTPKQEKRSWIRETWSKYRLQIVLVSLLTITLFLFSLFKGGRNEAAQVVEVEKTATNLKLILGVVFSLITIGCVAFFAYKLQLKRRQEEARKAGRSVPEGWKLLASTSFLTWLGVLAGVAVIAIFWKPILDVLFPALSAGYHATDGLGTMTWVIGATMFVIGILFASNKQIRDSKEWRVGSLIVLASLFIIAGILKGFDDRLGLTLVDLMGSAKFWLIIGVTACVWVYYKYPSHKGLKRGMLALILIIIFWIIPGAIRSNPKARGLVAASTGIEKSRAERGKDVAIYDVSSLRWNYNITSPAGFDKYGRFLQEQVTNDFAFTKLDNRICHMVMRDQATGNRRFFEGSMRAINIWRGYWREEPSGKVGWFELKDRGYPYVGHFQMVIAHEETGDAFPGYVRAKTREQLEVASQEAR